MKLANVNGRAVLVTGDDKGIDVATASDGQFGPEPADVYEQWDAFRAWSDGQTAPNFLRSTKGPASGSRPPARPIWSIAPKRFSPRSR